MPLTLSIAGISVTLDRFSDGEYPRTVIQGQNTAVEYSAAGTPNIQGSAYIGKHIWTTTAIVTKEQRDLLEAIAFESDARRRQLLPDYDILIYDATIEFKEKAPRTRQVIPGGTEVVYAGGLYVKYYAAFKGIFVDSPKFSKLGESIYDSVTLSLSETVSVGI